MWNKNRHYLKRETSKYQSFKIMSGQHEYHWGKKLYEIIGQRFMSDSWKSQLVGYERSSLAKKKLELLCLKELGHGVQ